MIALSGVQIIDLFFRFSSVGILLSIILLLLRAEKGKKSNYKWPLISCFICVIGYILLTSPIEDSHYGGLRHLLLLITDLTSFAILWLALSLLNPKFSLAKVNKWRLILIALYLQWLVYFFLVQGGHGIMHDVNHAIGLTLFICVIYLCLSEYFDDLDNQRRNNRLLLVAICVGYMSALSLFEFLLRDVRNTWQFSLINSVVAFSIVVFYLFNKLKALPIAHTTLAEPSKGPGIKATNLKQLMAEGVFLQPNLTIGSLATQLEMPAHQLRLVINQELGFSNFSHYLNSYRIPYICEQLKDPNQAKIPVLTLALEAGYGSIAPFNRAFKEKMGVTPTQFRSQF